MTFKRTRTISSVSICQDKGWENCSQCEIFYVRGGGAASSVFEIMELFSSQSSVTLLDIILDHAFSTCHKYPQPFSFRARTLFDQVSLSCPTIAPIPLLSVAPWELSGIHFCRSFLANKADLPGHVTELLFLDLASKYEGCTAVFSDCSKSDAGFGF